MNNTLLDLAKTADALVNDNLDMLDVSDESLRPFDRRDCHVGRTTMLNKEVTNIDRDDKSGEA